MNSKMTTNSKLSTTELKKKNPKQKQTTRTGTESQKWRSHGELSVGRGRMWAKVQGIRSINGRFKINRKFKNSIGNEEAKELTCMTHGHELSGRDCWREVEYQVEGEQREGN